jgi:hypothetical protein
LRRRRHVQPDRSDFLRHDRSLNTERLNTSVSVQGESAVGQDGDGGPPESGFGDRITWKDDKSRWLAYSQAPATSAQARTLSR